MNIKNILKTAYRCSHRQAVYCGDNRILTSLLSGHKMFVDSRDLSLSPHLIINGHWEPTTTQEIARHLKPGMRVVDVGANVGYYSLLMAQAIGPQGKLIAFEANPTLAKLVQDNLAINGFALGSGISQVRACAVSSFNGTTKFTIFDKLMGGSTVHDIAPQAGDGAQRVEVPCVTLDEALKDFGPVDFIKIDAEGAEDLILKGAQETIKNSPNLKMLIEFQSQEHLYDLVRAYGFKVYPLRDGKLPVETSFTDLQTMGVGDALLLR